MSTVASRTITSYDVLKTVGVICFILDHIGLYLLPEHEMLRALGRLSAPIFFFLIGYAKSRDVPIFWMLYLGLDLVVNAVLGLPLRPDVLLTLALVRLSMPFFEPLLYPRSLYTLAFFTLCLVMSPLVKPFLEYGSYAWVLAGVGYWIRKDGGEGMSWIAASLFGYFAIESFNFGFSEAALLVFVGGMVCVTAAICSFKPDAKLITQSRATAALYRFSGHHSLEIYALSLIALKFIWFFTQ